MVYYTRLTHGSRSDPSEKAPVMTCSFFLAPPTHLCSRAAIFSSRSTSTPVQWCHVFYAAAPPPPLPCPSSLFFLRAPGGASCGPVVEGFLHRPQPGLRPLSGWGPGPPPPPVLLPPPSLPKLAHLRPGPPRMPLRLACLAPPLTPTSSPPTGPRVPLGLCLFSG